jgi:toxin HigB-1
MQLIRAVPDETHLYNFKGLRFERLRGKRAHQRSLRLNGQYRLILEVEDRPGGNLAVVIAIEDYH